MDKIYVNIKEAAEMLGVSKLTLRNWDRDGKLSALRHPISNYRVYKTEDLKKLMHKMETGEKPAKTPKIKKTKEEPIYDVYSLANSTKKETKIFKVKVLHLED